METVGLRQLAMVIMAVDEDGYGFVTVCKRGLGRNSNLGASGGRYNDRRHD